MQSLQREGVNGGPHMYPPPPHLRMANSQNRMPVTQPRLNGQPYPMMQSQLQRQVSVTCFTLQNQELFNLIPQPPFRNRPIFSFPCSIPTPATSAPSLHHPCTTSVLPTPPAPPAPVWPVHMATGGPPALWWAPSSSFLQ